MRTLMAWLSQLQVAQGRPEDGCGDEGPAVPSNPWQAGKSNLIKDFGTYLRPPEAGRQDAGGPLRTGKLIMSPGRLSTQVCWRTDLFCNISTWWLACLGSSISRDQQLTRS
ncbi:unnamed protein product [Rangifer tarandus platyrhynchus]|uniref:Uncharacterized protein n=1 Tax=Rangifer tarandus platyrhynchus TaxID=3082113 RepID=A0AC59YF18_RANTA